MNWERDSRGGLVPVREDGDDDFRFRTNVPHLKHLEDVSRLALMEEQRWPGIAAGLDGPLAMDGACYRDNVKPTITADFATITLSTSSLMILNPISYLSTIAGYLELGKRWKITMMGKITTVLTPGNLTIEIRYGTTDNAGTILATSAATALAASKTNISWTLEAYIRANAQPGTAAGLFAWGKFMYDGAAALFTTTANNPLMIPASAAAAVNVDTTVAGGLNIQMKRSGSTVETITVQDLLVEACGVK